MNNKSELVYYYQRNNILFGDNVFSICYKASEDEIKQNSLTGSNVLVFIKSKEFESIDNSKLTIDRKSIIKEAFQGKDILLRVQSECLLGMYGDSHCDCESQREEAIRLIKENDGIFIHLPQEALGYGLEYKCKEVELQVNGRIQQGDFIGFKDKESAQTYLTKTNHYNDLRRYGIVMNIMKKLGLEKNKFILLSNSQSKLNDLECFGLRVEPYTDYVNAKVTSDNVSEYLSKILESNYNYSEDILDNIFEVINAKDFTDRTFEVLAKIVKKIDKDKDFKMSDELKKRFLDIYNDIICGKEKKYIYSDIGVTKIKNKYSCRVSSKVFGVIKREFSKNIFERIAAEQTYYFKNMSNATISKIRNSEILDLRDKNANFLKGQIYSQQTIFSEDNERILENEITNSRFKTYFENDYYEYIKKLETITFISENQINGLDIYIKRLPKIESRIMDVYGKKEDIKKFLERIDKDNVILSLKIEDEDDADYNLVFADYDQAKHEELHMFDILNKE